MNPHQIARQVATSKTARKARVHAERSPRVDETPLTGQLLCLLVSEVTPYGGRP
jgi:hypothetical protein